MGLHCCFSMFICAIIILYDNTSGKNFCDTDCCCFMDHRIFFVRHTYNDLLEYIKTHRFQMVGSIYAAAVIVAEIHNNSKFVSAVGMSVSLPMSLTFYPFRLRWLLLTLPALFYILLWCWSKISTFVIELWSETEKTDRRIYLYATAISAAVILILYTTQPQYYLQMDRVYSLYSGWCFNNVFADLYYYDIRHPIMGVVFFPIWAIINTTLKLFVSQHLLTGMCAACIQFLNIQALLAVGLIIEKMSKSCWVFLFYLASCPTLVFSVFFEKYQLIVLFSVIYIYQLYLRKRSESSFVIAAGIMPTSAVLYVNEFMIGNSLVYKLKNLLRTLICGLSVIICSGRIHILHPKWLLDDFISLAAYRSHDVTIKDSFYSLMNMIHGCFFSLSSVEGTNWCNEPCYTWNGVITGCSVVSVILIVVMLIGFFADRKDNFSKICIIWVVFSVVLFMGAKWSAVESPLFSIYFSWAFIPLFYKGLHFFCRKFHLKEHYVCAAVFATMIIVNTMNIISIGNFLKTFY